MKTILNRRIFNDVLFYPFIILNLITQNIIIQTMQSQKNKCNQCLKQFSLEMKPLKMPTCSHSVCQQCFQEIKDCNQGIVQCQFCDGVADSQSEGNSFLVNREITEKLKKRKSNDRINNKKKYKNQESNDPKIQVKKQNQDNELLLQDQSFDDSMSVLQKNIRFTKICEEHDKSQQIICLTDLHIICPHCAIFGNHKDHSFKTLKQFIKDFEINCELVQNIKKKKYVIDKKIKSNQQKDEIIEQIKKQENLLKENIHTKINQLILGLNILEETIFKDLSLKFQQISTEATKLLSQDLKTQQEFMKWESFSENILNKVQEEGIELEEKIHLMYGALQDIDRGEEIIEKLEANYNIISKRVESLMNSIQVKFIDSSQIVSSFVTITKKKEDEKRQNFLATLQKINLPSGNHLIEQLDDFSDNSFICDYSQGDLSLVMDEGLKKSNVTAKKYGKEKSSIQKIPQQKNPSKFIKKERLTTKDREKQFGYSTMALGSPTYKKSGHIKNSFETDKLIRSKSNSTLNILSDRDISLSRSKLKGTMSPRQKKLTQTRVPEQLERVPETIINDFLKHDLKEVLDLSNCEITDESVEGILKQVRRARKIRGMKISQNKITDQGFEKMVEYLGSTSNLNISYNKLTEAVLTSIINNRDKLAPLRIVNLSFNHINQKIAKTRIDMLKKMGVIINL